METRHQPCPPSGNRGHEEGMQARTHARIHPNTYARSCMHPRVLVCIARIHECIQDRVHTFLDAPTLRARALASEIVRTHPQTCTPRQHAHPHARTIVARRHNMYRLREERNIKPTTFGHLVSSMLYEKRFAPYFTAPVIAGLEEDGRAYLCGMDSIGAMETAEDFMVQVSGLGGGWKQGGSWSARHIGLITSPIHCACLPISLRPTLNRARRQSRYTGCASQCGGQTWSQR